MPIQSGGYIDVGGGCWRRNVLVTALRCWWRFWSFRSPTSTKRHQLLVTNIQTVKVVRESLAINVPFIISTTFFCWITITWNIAITIWQNINSRKLITTETVFAISKGSVLKMFAIVKTNIKCQSWNPHIKFKYPHIKGIRWTGVSALNGVWTISRIEIINKISTKRLIFCSFS